MIPLRDANPTHRTAIVTIGLIVTCFVLFAYQLGLVASAGEGALEGLFRSYGVVPVEVVAAWDDGTLVGGSTASLITSQFLHGGLLHLIGNMLYLWIFGNNVEDRLGRLAFIGFYLAGGIAAAVAQIAIDPTSDVPMIGASGAIAAVLGAYLVFYPRARITSLVFLGFFYQLIDVPALLVLVFWFVLQLIDGLASLGVASAGGGVAFFAHIGGFVFGVAAALLLRAAGRAGPARRAVVG